MNAPRPKNDGTDWLVNARDKVAKLKADGSLKGYDVYFVDGAGAEYGEARKTLAALVLY